MRVAFFSPLPPARSGIADYSEALSESLKRLVDLEVFSHADQAFDAARFDIHHITENNYQRTFMYKFCYLMQRSNCRRFFMDVGSISFQ